MKRCKYALLKKISLKYKIKVTCILIVCLLALNVYYRPVEVRAVTDPTLGEFVFSLFASQGIGLSDPNILTALQNTMSMGLAVGAEGIQNAITAFETATGGCDVITKTFTTTAGQAVTYTQQVGAENIIYVKEFASTAAENIEAAIQNYENFGFVAPAVGGMSLLPTVGLATLAVASGVGIGMGINAFREAYQQRIMSGLGLTSPMLQGSAYGMQVVCPSYYPQGHQYYQYNPIICYNSNYSDFKMGWYLKSNGRYCIWWKNLSSDHMYYALAKASNGDIWINSGVAPGLSTEAESYGPPTGGYAGILPNDITIDNTPVIKSPDVITANGNADTDSSYQLPDAPYIDVIPMEQAIGWANTASENTGGGITGTEQGEDFIELVEPYVLPNGPTVNPETTPDPDPSTAPQPTVDPVAPVWPQTNPNPVNPIQPTYLPLPTADPDAQPTTVPVVPPDGDLTPDQTGDLLKKGRIPGLENIFPFCIPFDIASLVKKLNVTRRAPVIEWQTDFGSWGSFGDIRIDLSIFDSAASMARTFELILFLLGLMIITKNLIGW